MKIIFWKLRLLFHYILSRFTCINQYCKRCGKSYPKEVWTTENGLWDRVIPRQKEYCIECFTDIAKSKEILIVWEAHEYIDYTEEANK